MILTRNDVAGLPRLQRLNLINSITGVKPANLIGTRSADGRTNLAIFSSVVHLGSHPPLIGLVVRPPDEVPRHTWQNIQESGWYTINQVPASRVAAAHQTSAKYDREVSEFDACGFTPRYLPGFSAPFVEESLVAMGMRFQEALPIRSNGTLLLIGEVELIILPDDSLSDEGHLDLEALDTAGISGLNTYYRLHRLTRFGYARTENSFDESKERQ